MYQPKRPKWAKEKITKYTKNKVPYFFISAKDKKREQVEDKNNSVVNKLNTIIKTPKLNFKSINERFTYKKLMYNSKIKIVDKDKKIINKYNELDIKNTFMINKNEKYKHRIIKMSYQYKKIREEILKVNNDPTYVTDILIKYLYSNKENNKKITLWECFGDVILENLKRNLTKGFKKEAIECKGCGVLIEKTSSTTKYCLDCAKEIDRKKAKERMRNIRNVRNEE